MIKAMVTVNMKRLLLFILTFWSTGSNENRVKIIETGLRADNESYECGERIMLTCIITEFSQFMLWQNDSSDTPLAQCTRGNCLFDGQSADIFKFTHNTSLAVFNLTIFQTTFVNNGATYKCKDVGTGDFSLSTIKVSDYLPITLDERGDNLTVTSGCIDPSVKVDIVWFKVKSDTGEESKYNPTTIVMPAKQVACSTDNICGLSSYIHMTTTIALSQGGYTAYKLKAVLFYNGERKESNTTETAYMIKEKSKRETESTDTKWYTKHLPCLIVFGVVTLGIIVTVILWKRRHGSPKPQTDEQNTHNKATSTDDLDHNRFCVICATNAETNGHLYNGSSNTDQNVMIPADSPKPQTNEQNTHNKDTSTDDLVCYKWLIRQNRELPHLHQVFLIEHYFWRMRQQSNGEHGIQTSYREHRRHLL